MIIQAKQALYITKHEVHTSVLVGNITYKTISVLDSIPFPEFKTLVCK